MKVLLLILLTGIAVAFPSEKQKRNAEECNYELCKLPECQCSGVNRPAGISENDSIPQIVMLTYDDAVSTLNYNSYYSPLLKKRINPNGCPVSATFYVCHEYTDYSYVQKLYNEGHEIAVHSITHRSPIQWWAAASYEDWQKEMAGMREIIHRFGNVKKEDIVGIRTPFLQSGGENQFKMMKDEKFLYDTTLPTRKFTAPPLWPYTFDYETIQECHIPPCPKESYPGVWEVPLVDYIDIHKNPCPMVDGCARPKDENEAFQLLWNNFLRHYNSTKAPFPVFLHAAWFQWDHHFKGMIRFLNAIQTLDDVYIVSVKQAIDWLKNPTLMENIKNFESWNYTCKKDHDRPPRCKRAKSCPYSTSFGIRYMSLCTDACPKTYPWFNNPTGEGPMP